MSARRLLPAWQGGWWNGARRCPSPNFGARPREADISLIVVHSISLPPGVYRGDDVERLFLNQLVLSRHPYYQGLRDLRVSAHFLIRRDGHIVQFVSCLDRAWHAGQSQWRGRPDCNDVSIGIELEGLEGDRFAAAQYRGLIRLVRVLASRYPVAETVGHEHVAPERKHDPGPGFDWARLRSGLRGCRVRVWPLTGDRA